MSDSDSPPAKNSFKSLLVKGFVGAITLIGTTAIPIVVQRFLQAPTASTATPTSEVISPAQVSPLSDESQIESTEASQETSRQGTPDEQQDGKGKKKTKVD